MTKMKIEHSFQDIHTGVIYGVGTIQDFADERIAEINKNLPGFIQSVKVAEAKAPEDDAEAKAPEDDAEAKAAKKSSKKKEVTDELPDGET